MQYAKEEVQSPTLGVADKKFIQAVTGTLLYYARVVDPKILVALSAIAATQVAPTQETMKKALQLLDHCASQEEAIITYRKSDMVLGIHSDAGYLN